MLRYSLDESDRDTCLVGEELTMLQQYVRIQQARFPDRFTYAFEIEEPVRSMRMYKFLLQPLLENAFQHGIGTTLNVSHLLVRGKFEKGRLSFTVSNTGAPMPAETLDALRRYIHCGKPRDSSVRTGIGLHNVIDRIHLYFGDAGSIIIDSNMETGTSVTIQFPPL